MPFTCVNNIWGSFKGLMTIGAQGDLDAFGKMLSLR